MPATRALTADDAARCNGNSEFPSATSSRVTALGSSPLIPLELCGNFVSAPLPPPESMLSPCQSAVIKRKRERKRERERERDAGIPRVRGCIAQRIIPFADACTRQSAQSEPEKLFIRRKYVVALAGSSLDPVDACDARTGGEHVNARTV